MASPYQQQAFQRKLIYIGSIIVLFTFAWVWRHYVVLAQANQLQLRESARGNEEELSGAVVRIGLLGSQGLTTCLLWNDAIDKQRKNQWNELKLRVSWLTRLQPHFITPWLFQSWNLAYNVSVESDRISDKYFYITEGVNLLARGERQNRDNPDLRWSIGFYTMHKIGQSDETNVQRSLFQLSCIPPHERDPARFWKQTESGGTELDWAEFEKFCRAHPQLIRRLKVGMHKDTLREKKRLFVCERPEQVVDFLEANYQVPGLYPVVPPPAGVPAYGRTWNPNQPSEIPLQPADRFPVVPPKHAGGFDDTALNDTSELGDDVDVYMVSHAWYSYAQEPLPEPGDLPGSSKEIKDPAHQRKPRYMTTLIFRNYPAQGRRYSAERLQQEGWYDEEKFDLSDWFEQRKDRGESKVEVGGGQKVSLIAWRLAKDAWEKHGLKNHLLFEEGDAGEENNRVLAERFAKRYPMMGNGSPPPLQEEKLSPQEREEYRAAIYRYELKFYRQVSNFLHHYNRCQMEAMEETVAARKLLHEAEYLNLTRGRDRALEVYDTPRKIDAGPRWKETALSPLQAWRDLILATNEKFRRDSFIQEQTAEYQLRYLSVFNASEEGSKLKEKIGKLARALPLVPKMDKDTFPENILVGPFAGTDPQGFPWIDPSTLKTVFDRMNPGLRRAPPATPEVQPVKGEVR
jgi:hypothetical protein